MSLGGDTSDSLDLAVCRSIAAGVVHAVAAGNSSGDACQGSPARVAQALTLGASDSADRPAGFSDKGGCVDLFAPGVNIESAECTARPGPWSGAPVFHLEMTLAVPDQRLVGELREALWLLGRDEGIDFELRAAV